MSAPPSPDDAARPAASVLSDGTILRLVREGASQVEATEGRYEGGPGASTGEAVR